MWEETSDFIYLLVFNKPEFWTTGTVALANSPPYPRGMDVQKKVLGIEARGTQIQPTKLFYVRFSE